MGGLQEGKEEWGWVQGVTCVGLLSWKGGCHAVVWGWLLLECRGHKGWGELCFYSDRTTAGLPSGEG